MNTENKKNTLLRFFTAGSVDDGKSTLIGRLMYDTKNILANQYELLKTASERRGRENVDLALLTDGLRAEREQGITIDVAYRYFSTPNRKFIMADTPGHEQYTRNMVTGASTADVAFLLVDVRDGAKDQTHRHLYISHLLGVSPIIVCVNKMDLVGYDEEKFNTVKNELEGLGNKLGIPDMRIMPISALVGDNVVDKSDNMPWYNGPTVLDLLESIEKAEKPSCPRFPVSVVIRHDEYRGYAGRLMGGQMKVGDEIIVLPSGMTSKISQIDTPNGEKVNVANIGDSVTIKLETDVDVSRGDVIVPASQKSQMGNQIEAKICWLDADNFNPSQKYTLQIGTNKVQAMITEVVGVVSVKSLDEEQKNDIGMNDLAHVQIMLSKEIPHDKYETCHATGGFILVHPVNNRTVAGGIIL